MHEHLFGLPKFFEDRVQAVKKGYCPICASEVHPNKEFRDERSIREYKLSGLCQKCQDAFFEGGEDLE